MSEVREGGLVRWQWSLYPDGHRDRRNLAIHAITVPLFVAGSATLPLAAFAGVWWAAGSSLLLMIGALAAQGRGHKLESTAPVPFRSPIDAVARLFVEQWITFPRYVLSGQFARAWRAR
jgi:hypothetical protein